MTTPKKDFWEDRTGPMAEEEVKEIALSILQGGRWRFIKPENLREQILFLSFVDLSEYYKRDIDQVGTVLGDASQAAGSVNGLNCYMGGRFIHKEDWSRIVEKLRALEQAMKAV